MKYIITKVQLDNVIGKAIDHLQNLSAKHLAGELKFTDSEKSEHGYISRKLQELVSEIKGYEKLPADTKQMFKALEATVNEQEAAQKVNENALILHCEICSQEGKRMSKESKLAVINEDVLKLPLDMSMFSAFEPERGIDIQLAFSPQDGRLIHKHLNHAPWVVTSEVIEQIRKNGGPSRLLTNKGYIYIDKTGIVKREWEEKPEPKLEPKEKTPDEDKEPPKEQPEKLFKCEEPGCDKGFATKPQLQGHMNWHKRKK
uniref:C2H2-type domain-containing protein n=1 Tax=viral metagenome TaxID=1070528 RepID=A0A6M3L766_9ZZZZ